MKDTVNPRHKRFGQPISFARVLFRAIIAEDDGCCPSEEAVPLGCERYVFHAVEVTNFCEWCCWVLRFLFF